MLTLREINNLSKHLDNGKIIFYNLCGNIFRVREVLFLEAEGGYVATINSGLGHYVSLDNCEYKDFYLATSLEDLL